jgi:kinesin family protein C2/C3
MAAKVAWDFVHGASSPTDGGSTRFSSIAPTETDISSLFSDDDVGGSNGSSVNPRKQFDPEALRLAVCAALRNSGSADIYRSACGQESKLDGIRLDLAQAVQEAQNACAAQADIPILTAARDHLLADLARAKELCVPREELAPAELQRRKVHNAIQDLKGQVRVLCRLRPQTPTEKLEDDSEKLRVLSGDCVESPLAGTFFFNGVFAPGTQEGIFDECKDLVQSAVDGHNVTIFSYGQTGAGKTFTMYGTPQAEGLVTRMVDELFNRIDGLQDSYTVAVEGSIAEIYNNRFIDLLNPASRLIEKPRLRQGKEGHVHTDDFSKWMVSNGRQLKELIEHGFAQRSVAETVMNTQSSRSHLILTVKLVRTDKATGETRTSKMVFCDLAGSERLKKTEAVGERKKEAIEINKSLAALGDVIEAVAAKRKHVPYRNHTLTRILQDSLGGTAKTLMFVHCSPANSSASETAMSLKFAARAGRIINAECNRQGNCQSRSRSV